jgi:purine-binding chemotaxis protein CheW
MSTAHEESHASRQFVVFHIGKEEYALPIGQIQEVIRYTQPRSVVSEDPWVVGVISLRGKIVPIGDLAGRLGVSATHSEDSKIVIIETPTGTVGMMVDAVDEVLSIGADQLDTSTVTDRDIVRGIAKLDQRLVVILDSEALGVARADAVAA